MLAGYVVMIDWSQTDQTYVFVKNAQTKEEAIKYVQSSCNCSRIYVREPIKYIIEINNG